MNLALSDIISLSNIHYTHPRQVLDSEYQNWIFSVDKCENKSTYDRWIAGNMASIWAKEDGKLTFYTITWLHGLKLVFSLLFPSNYVTFSIISTWLNNLLLNNMLASSFPMNKASGNCRANCKTFTYIHTPWSSSALYIAALIAVNTSIHLLFWCPSTPCICLTLVFVFVK